MSVDWIDNFVEATESTGSPEIFRLWSGISCVAGILERRVWARTRLGVCYPNLYIMLVAPPGVGKSTAMRPVEEIWIAQNCLKISPKSMTKAALIDILSHSRELRTVEGSEALVEYTAVQVCISEMANLVSTYDHDFLGVLCDIFDNPRTFREQRRHVNKGEEIQITNPCLNMLLGAQPGYLTSILPEEAWVQGTTSRFIMVYAGKTMNIDLFGTYIPTEDLIKELGEAAKPWTKLVGQCKWHDSAVEAIQTLHSKNGLNLFDPVPSHPKLTSYVTRRTQFIIKLSIVSAISRTSDIIIEGIDIDRAKHWLLEAEKEMANIFDGMSIKTDAQLIEEFHIYAWKLYRDKTRDGEKFGPLPTKVIWEFLTSKVASERIPKIIEVMHKSGLIEDVGGMFFKPKARLDLGQGAWK